MCLGMDLQIVTKSAILMTICRFMKDQKCRKYCNGTRQQKEEISYGVRQKKAEILNAFIASIVVLLRVLNKKRFFFLLSYEYTKISSFYYNPYYSRCVTEILYNKYCLLEVKCEEKRDARPRFLGLRPHTARFRFQLSIQFRH